MYWVFTIDQGVPPDQRSALEAEADALRRRIKRSIQTLTCPIHGRSPQVRVTGFASGQLDLQVSGCCHDFVRRVKWRIDD